MDHIPHLEIPARMAAEFAAGAGHDIILNNSTILARLYYKNLVDLTDISDAAGKKYGGWIPAAKSPIEVEGRCYGIPMYYILLPMLWRKDLFDGSELKSPDTWELARVAARTLKPKGQPTGIAFSQCNDANLFWRSMIFSFGGTETDPSGENPTLDSKEMREFLPFAKAMFDEGMTPEVFSWDDASDNRFLASGIASWIHDAISAYRTTESTNPAVFKNTFLALEPAGAARQAGQRGRAHRLPGVEVLEEPAGGEGIPGPPRGQRQGGHDPEHRLQHALPERQRYKKPMPIIGADPKMQVLQDFPKIVAFFGYPGPSTPQIQEVANLSSSPTSSPSGRAWDIVDSLKWGVGEYRRIFSKYKRA